MTTPASETVAAVLDDDGAVVNIVVVDPATVMEYEAALHAEAVRAGGRGPVVRVLTADERQRGVGIGWRRSANGRMVDERPSPPPPSPPSPPRADPAPTPPA